MQTIIYRMMEVRILSPGKKLFEGKADSITFPGKEGQFQVLQNHAPIFSLLKKGEIIIGDKKKRIPILSGVVECVRNEIIALVEDKNE